MEVGDAQLAPVLAVVGAFEQEIRPIPADPVPHLPVARGDVLRGPIRKPKVGDDRTEAAEFLALVLGRHLDPVLAIDTYHQPALIIFLPGTELDVGFQAEIALELRQEAMPIVPLKAIVGVLPEIGLFIREDLQSVAKLEPGRFVEPVEGAWPGWL